MEKTLFPFEINWVKYFGIFKTKPEEFKKNNPKSLKNSCTMKTVFLSTCHMSHMWLVSGQPHGRIGIWNEPLLSFLLAAHVLYDVFYYFVWLVYVSVLDWFNCSILPCRFQGYFVTEVKCCICVVWEGRRQRICNNHALLRTETHLYFIIVLDYSENSYKLGNIVSVLNIWSGE